MIKAMLATDLDEQDVRGRLNFSTGAAAAVHHAGDDPAEGVELDGARMRGEDWVRLYGRPSPVLTILWCLLGLAVIVAFELRELPSPKPFTGAAANLSAETTAAPPRQKIADVDPSAKPPAPRRKERSTQSTQETAAPRNRRGEAP